MSGRPGRAAKRAGTVTFEGFSEDVIGEQFVFWGCFR